jgi:hypothetical protein
VCAKDQFVSTTSLRGESPKPSDAIQGSAEIVVERQGLTGRRWTGRFVRDDGPTVLKGDRHYFSAQEAYEAGQRACNERRRSP